MKWPEIHNDMFIPEYQEYLISIARKYVNTASLPEVARDEMNEMITRLDDYLEECNKLFENDTQQYKICVKEKLDAFESEVWDLTERLIEDEEDEEMDFDFDSCGKFQSFSWLMLCALVVIKMFS